MNPRHPVYVISKGRAESRLTSRSLEAMRVPYRIVVEPQEEAEYAAVIDPAKILVLPFSNLGEGSIPARNWVWQHALSEGAERHWILDDNIRDFYRFNRNLRVRVGSGTIFRCAEDFTERYTNIGVSGFQYRFFVASTQLYPPYVRNTRVYSCILIDNSLPFRWRGRYNEDTDLSLRVLKDGRATVLFNAFLIGKEATMTMAGGNSDELYAAEDGRLKMAESLAEQHPDVASVTWKYGRWQHHVDYRKFKHNRLERRADLTIRPGVDNYGMILQTIPEDQTRRAKRSQPVQREPVAVVQREEPRVAEPASGDTVGYDPVLIDYSNPDDDSIGYGQLGWGSLGYGTT